MPKISKYNGGYVIISLNDEDIYEKIERNLYKPILLTDIVINGIEKNDVFTTAYVEGTNIVFKDIYDKDITISDDNSITIGDNGKHLYRYNFNFSDSWFQYLSNKPFSRLNESILISNTSGGTELTTSETKELIKSLDSKTHYCPMSITSDLAYRANCYISLDELNLIISQTSSEVSQLNLTIYGDGRISESEHKEDLYLFVEKIF